MMETNQKLSAIKVLVQNLYPNLKIDPARLGTISDVLHYQDLLQDEIYTFGQLFKMQQTEVEKIAVELENIVRDLRL